MIAHLKNMTKPAKTALAEGKLHGGEISMFQYLIVDDLLLLSNSKDLMEAS